MLFFFRNKPGADYREPLPAAVDESERKESDDTHEGTSYGSDEEKTSLLSSKGNVN